MFVYLIVFLKQILISNKKPYLPSLRINTYDKILPTVMFGDFLSLSMYSAILYPSDSLITNSNLYKKQKINKYKVELTIKKGLSWPWSYGSWIYNYLCNQCLSPGRGVQHYVIKFVSDLKQVGAINNMKSNKAPGLDGLTV